MCVSARVIKNELRRFASVKKARVLRRFFKTGPGEYGFGDRFLGIVVPDIRFVARKYFHLIGEREISRLVGSSYHEERLLGFLIQVLRFKNASGRQREALYRWYTRRISRVNNWDLVDLTAPHIVGAYVYGKSTKPLYLWARSKNIWKRRIAIVATLSCIRQGQYRDTCAIATILLNDPHDLIHKACGWMLREVGKKDVAVLERYLQTNASLMPRTMLRYAIERFPEHKRRHYLRMS